jgi:hypothetical protein
MNRFAFLSLSLLVFSGAAFSSGCITHAVRVEPIALEPVQVTMDVNLHVDDTRSQGGDDTRTQGHEGVGEQGADE